MTNVNERNYDNLSEAVAFVIRFAFMVYTYDDIALIEYERELCSRCREYVQVKDYLAPKSSCKKEFGVLGNQQFGVSEQIKNELISNFDIEDADFRQICNKVGDVVYWQITPQHTMLPIAGVNRTRQLKPCRKCGSVQYRMKEYENDKGYNYYYITQEALQEMSDLNKTVERFEMFIPEYVVSRRVYDYLIEKYPRMVFEPMFMKEQ